MPFHIGLLGKYDKRYYEMYKHPTRADLKQLAEQTEYPHKCRLLLTEEGELYAFNIELLHHLASAELDEEGLSILCFFDDNRLEAADVGNLEHTDICRAIQQAADAFRRLGLGDETEVRVILNQGIWGDKSLTFREVVAGNW
ncbi:hypothetical protein [Tumebacillus permanentifrigoris]|uniref:Uncharacterized protein n=1 Tax=Tumebacillus permanentifrigoris TaxID=378543 RepID=A0A316D871_9BACL|nr:hypothetical protein [Tumebacillus permanentifrigoris]PWK11347.1 hypothetical protein C7459_111143 [Tumebacillus permanentifrigoris]